MTFFEDQKRRSTFFLAQQIRIAPSGLRGLRNWKSRLLQSVSHVVYLTKGRDKIPLISDPMSAQSKDGGKRHTLYVVRKRHVFKVVKEFSHRKELNMQQFERIDMCL